MSHGYKIFFRRFSPFNQFSTQTTILLGLHGNRYVNVDPCNFDLWQLFVQKASLLSKSQHMRRSIVELSRTAVTILYRTVTCYSHMLQCSSSSYNKLL